MSRTASPSSLPYRPCVGVALFNRDGLVFVGKRIDAKADDWQMPQGGIDEGEDISSAAFRELYEETGVKSAEIIRIAEQTIAYDLPATLQPKLWGGAFRGQEQTWVAMRFTGEDSEITLNAHNAPEFEHWKWVRLEQTPDLIIPFKYETYSKVVRLFTDISGT
ncbi:MAG: RNA pyrophosphohydrolase [Alphaproteobacteria bacterium]|nr:RNA pyrophosphohydrolase [Alphaproteobacteria bacterium]